MGQPSSSSVLAVIGWCGAADCTDCVEKLVVSSWENKANNHKDIKRGKERECVRGERKRESVGQGGVGEKERLSGRERTRGRK